MRVVLGLANKDKIKILVNALRELHIDVLVKGIEANRVQEAKKVGPWSW